MSNAPHMELEEIDQMLTLAMKRKPVSEIAKEIGRSRQAVYHQFLLRDIPTDPKFRNPTHIFSRISNQYVKPPYSENTLVTTKLLIDQMINNLSDMSYELNHIIEDMQLQENKNVEL